MAVLTDCAPDPHRPGYRVLEVDRGRFASLPEDALHDLYLVVGVTLDPSTHERLQYLADVEAALRAALRAQARRSHARNDLRRRLILKQHPPPAVDAALERLTIDGFLDDRRFAEHYVATRAAQGRGPARLVQDLVRQGVDRRVAEEAVHATLVAEQIDPDHVMRRVVERRAAQLGDLPPVVKRRRLVAYLSRRGYRGHGVRQLVDEVAGAGEA